MWKPSQSGHRCFFVASSASPLKLSKLLFVKFRDCCMAPFFTDFTSQSRPSARADDSSFEANPPMAHADTQLVLKQQCSHRTNDSQQTLARSPLILPLFVSNLSAMRHFFPLLKLIFSLNCMSQNGGISRPLLSA